MGSDDAPDERRLPPLSGKGKERPKNRRPKTEGSGGKAENPGAGKRKPGRRLPDRGTAGGAGAGKERKINTYFFSSPRPGAPTEKERFRIDSYPPRRLLCSKRQPMILLSGLSASEDGGSGALFRERGRLNRRSAAPELSLRPHRCGRRLPSQIRVDLPACRNLGWSSPRGSAGEVALIRDPWGLDPLIIGPGSLQSAFRMGEVSLSICSRSAPPAPWGR